MTSQQNDIDSWLAALRGETRLPEDGAELRRIIEDEWQRIPPHAPPDYVRPRHRRRTVMSGRWPLAMAATVLVAIGLSLLSIRSPEVEVPLPKSFDMPPMVPVQDPLQRAEQMANDLRAEGIAATVERREERIFLRLELPNPIPETAMRRLRDLGNVEVKAGQTMEIEFLRKIP